MAKLKKLEKFSSRDKSYARDYRAKSTGDVGD